MQEINLSKIKLANAYKINIISKRYLNVAVQEFKQSAAYKT